MGKILKKIGIISSLASRYIGIIIIAFSCLAFFWRDGFSWMTNYTSVFLGVIMFGMGLTIKLDDFRAIFSSGDRCSGSVYHYAGDRLASV